MEAQSIYVSPFAPLPHLRAAAHGGSSSIDFFADESGN